MEEEEKILKLSDSFERQEKEPVIEEAIRDCLNCGFLTELLTKYRQEVIGMLLTEYDEKRHLKNTYEQGRADGWADGNKEGLRQGIRKEIERERYRTAHNLYLRGFTPQDAAIILEEDEKTVTSWYSSFCYLTPNFSRAQPHIGDGIRRITPPPPFLFASGAPESAPG